MWLGYGTNSFPMQKYAINNDLPLILYLFHYNILCNGGHHIIALEVWNDTESTYVVRYMSTLYRFLIHCTSVLVLTPTWCLTGLAFSNVTHWLHCKVWAKVWILIFYLAIEHLFCLYLPCVRYKIRILVKTDGRVRQKWYNFDKGPSLL